MAQHAKPHVYRRLWLYETAFHASLSGSASQANAYS